MSVQTPFKDFTLFILFTSVDEITNHLGELIVDKCKSKSPLLNQNSKSEESNKCFERKGPGTENGALTTKFLRRSLHLLSNFLFAGICWI